MVLHIGACTDVGTNNGGGGLMHDRASLFLSFCTI